MVQEYERAVIFRLGRLRKEGSKVKYCCFDQFQRKVVCLEHKPAEPWAFSVLYFCISATVPHEYFTASTVTCILLIIQPPSSGKEGGGGNGHPYINIDILGHQNFSRAERQRRHSIMDGGKKGVLNWFGFSLPSHADHWLTTRWSDAAAHWSDPYLFWQKPVLIL